MDEELELKNEKDTDDSASKKKPSDSLFAKVQSRPVKTLRKLISVTEDALLPRQQTWNRYRRKYRRGLNYLMTTSSQPAYFTNYIYAVVESIKANFVRNLPPLVATPRGARDDLAADIMSRILQDSFKRGGFRDAAKEVLHHGSLSTLGYFKIYFADDLDRLVVEAINPDDLLVDPNTKTVSTARWVIHRRYDVTVEELYAMYGKVPDPESELSDVEDEDSMRESRESAYLSTGELAPARDVSRGYTVYECWIRVWDEDRENDWYVVTMAGNTILKQGFSPYDHNQVPFVEWVCNIDYNGDNLYNMGAGIVEEIEPLQDRADALDLRITRHIALLTNRQRYVSKQSALNVNTMDNTAGRTYQVQGDPRMAVFYDAPPQLPLEVYNYRDRTEPLIQTVSGVLDVTQGRRPVGITAGRAIEALKDSAETRLAATLDTFADAYKRLGELGLQIILQFYSGQRMIRSVDADADQDMQVLDKYPEELAMPEDADEETEAQIAQAREQFKKENGIALVFEDITYEWDLDADTDSALPSTRAERAQVASELFRIGAIDREAVLDAVDFPQRFKIMKRLAGQVTGKNAGDAGAEAGVGMAQNMMDMFSSILSQLGLPPEQVDALMAEVASQAGGGGATAQAQPPQAGGNFPPQMTM